MRKIIIILILFLVLLPTHLSAANGYKKDIVIKETGGLKRNPGFITLTVEDPNLSGDDCILVDKDTKKEIPFHIVDKEKGKIRIRFKLNLNKGEEKNLEFRFSTGEKRSILPEKDFSFVDYIGTE
ncbi:MAG TPA: hypothetical protein ENG37_00225, partial [Firmicutes bacterium]|nr:hypothetical protein [Bacillota bacterium]